MLGVHRYAVSMYHIDSILLKFGLLVLAALPTVSSGNSPLPPCRGGNHAWDNCFGELKSGAVVVYSGEWKAGDPHGRGVFLFPDGTRYIGEFQYGKQHGRGTLVFPGGGSLSGTWVNEKREGEFVWTLSNGTRSEVVYVADELARVVKPIANCTQPKYPLAARRSGAEGTVVISFTMDTEGKIIEAEVRQSSGHTTEHKLLDRFSLNAVKNCIGKPGLVNGVPSVLSGQVVYKFRLAD